MGQGEPQTDAVVGMSLPNEARSGSLARQALRRLLAEMRMEELAAAAELVVTELVTNAVLHSDGPVRLEVRPAGGGGVRLNVYDVSPHLPVVPAAANASMTGRGLLLVRSLSARFGFEPAEGGKVVWAEVREVRQPGDADTGELIDAWVDLWDDEVEAAPARYHVELGEVPTDLLLAAKAHVDNLVREFLLAAAGAQSGSTAAVPPHLAQLIEAVVNRFAEARLSIKRQALEAARRGVSHVRLQLDLPADAADAGEEYLQALDEADAYCRAARLLTLETPPKHKVFRHWYVGELVDQLRRAEAGLPSRPPQPFEQRLLEEIDVVATARAAADRAARLYTVVSALTGAMTPEAVAEAVLADGMAALGANGGGLLLPGPDRLVVPGTVGYDDRLVESLRDEPAGAELPAAVALRTGEPVWLESREERDARFPALAHMERATISMCAVPLRVGDRLLGALRFSFSEPRLFGEDERRFVLALAAQAAQALDRAQLYRDRSELSQRFQRSLLPPGLPVIPGLDMAAAYHPLGDGVEAGGDFYDAWAVSDGEWAFALGDVCGTGPEAAGLAARVRYSLRSLTTPRPDHVAVLGRLNQVLLDGSDDDAERFCTVIFGTLETAPGVVRIRIATGGHPEPLLRRGDGEVAVVPTGGSLLGIIPSVDIVVDDVELREGDSIVFYTDGVTEARRRGIMLGTEGLADVIRKTDGDAVATAAVVEAAVLDYSGGTLDDDMAVLVMRAVPSPPRR